MLDGGVVELDAVDLDHREDGRPVRAAVVVGRAEEVGQELRGRVLVVRRDQDVVEADGHGPRVPHAGALRRGEAALRPADGGRLGVRRPRRSSDRSNVGGVSSTEQTKTGGRGVIVALVAFVLAIVVTTVILVVVLSSDVGSRAACRASAECGVEAPIAPPRSPGTQRP